MEKDKLIAAENILKDSGTSQAAIDEILQLLEESREAIVASDRENFTEEEIKMKIMEENDWRKKATLSAMLISKSLKDL